MTRPSIAVDAMGGDRAPEAIVAGALLAAGEVGRLLLVGDPERLRPLLAGAPENVAVVASEGAVAMGDAPLVALKRAPRSSIRVAAALVKRGEADMLLSAGHTGAVVGAAQMTFKRVRGVKRTAIAVNLPTLSDGYCTVLDVGATVTCRPAHLLQFAVMGHTYARLARGLVQPRVGLLNMGSETGKRAEVRKAHAMITASGLPYAGYVEGEDLFHGKVDVVVCEGFVGNSLLKATEAFAGRTLEFLKVEAVRLGVADAAAPLLARYAALTDFAEVGGAPLLGTRSPCIICHGKSDARAIGQAIAGAARTFGYHHQLKADLERYRAGWFRGQVHA